MRHCDAPRFQKFVERQRATSLPWSVEFQANIKNAKWSENGKAGVSWKGVRLLKDPFSLSLYTSLLWELKPKTIIEIGAFEGGSALWFADISEALGIDSHVIAYDIDLSHIKVTDGKVEFRQLDAMQIRERMMPEELASMPRPFLLVEDAHVNLEAVLESLYSVMEVGDYLVVEDTCESQKHEEMGRFMAHASPFLCVDTFYTDNFGYNASWNWNSFLRRMA